MDNSVQPILNACTINDTLPLVLPTYTEQGSMPMQKAYCSLPRNLSLLPSHLYDFMRGLSVGFLEVYSAVCWEIYIERTTSPVNEREMA